MRVIYNSEIEKKNFGLATQPLHLIYIGIRSSAEEKKIMKENDLEQKPT